MENLNETNQTAIIETMLYNGPIGNKFEQLVEGVEFTPISRIIAESFIDNAKRGTLSFLKAQNVNFNLGGIYEMKYSLLKDICKVMEEIQATYLTFTFVQIDPRDQRLQCKPYSENKMMYMIASLQTQSKETIKENNYLIINVKQDLSLGDLKISDEDLNGFRESYLKNGHLLLTDYLKNNNTLYISYHIVDLLDTLSKDVCEQFIINLCEISDVKKVIFENNLGDRLLQDQYKKFFETREKQMTLVFSTDKGYYDMGSLYP
ncbi:hypothetical protein [Chryseobacterium gallinarum]|uniref:DUF1828 domain-containing protein n=1 Tax=Chryseobacterium gallinarum TaxID=1324352 RepID=A0ABX6KTW3_CHRGL|nr:hypothetical protein [Chryseobacterium gallinarum]QIY91283.1 hypothetical protein FOB44_11830 [Chryseobacterium gallinarum]